MNGVSAELTAESPFDLRATFGGVPAFDAREVEGPFEFGALGETPATGVAPLSRDLERDAFYEDEWQLAPAAPNPRRVHFSRFTAVSAIAAVPQTLLTSRPNPLDARVTAGLVAPEVIPPGRSATTGESYWVFVPDAFKAAVAQAAAAGTTAPVARLSVLFGVGAEMNRHGLRSFFSGSADRIFIEVGGVESVPEQTGPWGIGLTDAMIADLLRAAVGVPVSVKLEVLAAYSTGYRGLNGTINNALLNLSQLKKLIFFDCLYRADEPKAPAGAAFPPRRPPGAPAHSAFNTWRAVQAVSAASSACAVIVYDVTPGGTPTASDGALRVDIPGANTIRLKPLNVELKAIVLARLMDNGLKDGYFSAAQIPAGIRALIPLLPRRGTLSSDRSISTPGTLGAWAHAHATEIAASVPGFAGAMELARKHKLLGWETPPTEFGHDGFLPEFGWEHLAG